MINSSGRLINTVDGQDIQQTIGIGGILVPVVSDGFALSAIHQRESYSSLCSLKVIKCMDTSESSTSEDRTGERETSRAKDAAQTMTRHISIIKYLFCQAKTQQQIYLEMVYERILCPLSGHLVSHRKGQIRNTNTILFQSQQQSQATSLKWVQKSPVTTNSGYSIHVFFNHIITIDYHFYILFTIPRLVSQVSLTL